MLVGVSAITPARSVVVTRDELAPRDEAGTREAEARRFVEELAVQTSAVHGASVPAVMAVFTPASPG